ncbi:hypothetical protein Tco_1571579 [Tanacetum coccineum]
MTSSSNRRGAAKTTLPWTTVEQITLCTTWCNAMDTYVTRDIHSRKGFWEEVFANFKKDTGGTIQGYDAIVSKWKNSILPKVAAFSVIYDGVQWMDENEFNPKQNPSPSVDSSGLSHDESFRVDDLDLNLNKEPDVNLNVSQVETQYELPVSDEPDVGYTQEPILAKVSTQEPIVAEVSIQEPIMAEVSTEAPIVEEDNGQEDELAPTDGQFIYNDEGIDTAYETEYDVQSSEDAVPHDVLEGEDVDVVNVDGFDSDPGNDEERNYRKRRLAELRTKIEEAKDRVYLHFIESIRNLKLYKNDSVRIRARCEGKVPVFTMSQGTGPTGPNRRMEAGPSGSSGPTTRSKKRKNTCTNDDNQVTPSFLNTHDKGDLCPWVLYVGKDKFTHKSCLQCAPNWFVTREVTFGETKDQQPEYGHNNSGNQSFWRKKAIDG